jgi:hypothetical protein
MMPKVALLLDRTATMAVRTPGLTFGDLAFNGGDRVFLVGELYHAVAFCAYVIEVQDDRIAFPAVRTPGALQVFDDELQVALPQGTALSGCPPVRIDPPRSSPQRGSAAVAIGAHELAVGDLLDDLAQPVALAHKTANLGSFWPHVVEFEYERIGATAVTTAAGQQQVDNELPRGCSPLVASGSRLTSMQVASGADVVAATVLALTLLAVKARQREGALTASASCRAGRLRSPSANRVRRSPRRIDVGRPDACGRERDVEFPGDAAERPSLSPEQARFRLLRVLWPSHRTHVRIRSGRTRVNSSVRGGVV